MDLKKKGKKKKEQVYSVVRNNELNKICLNGMKTRYMFTNS